EFHSLLVSYLYPRGSTACRTTPMPRCPCSTQNTRGSTGEPLIPAITSSSVPSTSRTSRSIECKSFDATNSRHVIVGTVDLFVGQPCCSIKARARAHGRASHFALLSEL